MSVKPLTVLVTGAAGFLGRHVLEHLADPDDQPVKKIVAVDRRMVIQRGENVEWTGIDLADGQSVAAMLRQAEPNVILHLAGVTGHDAAALQAANVDACRHLLEAAATLRSRPRVVVVGSAAMYGPPRSDAPIHEDHPLGGETAYACSKIKQERLAMSYGGELEIVAVRPFNIIGPGQPDSLVPGAFLAQAADVRDGGAEDIGVGNTAAQRDFVDVRDVAAALWTLATAEDVAGEAFNIASGRAVGIDEMLDACVDLAGGEITVTQDPDRFKPIDVPRAVGDPQKLIEATGWQPRYDWRTSLADQWAALRE